MSRRLDDTDCSTLLSRLQRYAGDALRGAVSYDGEDHELLYIRADIDGMYVEDDIDRIIGDVLSEAVAERDSTLDDHELGSLEATVRWFDEGIMLHVPAPETTGLVASFDHTMATDLGTLVSVATAFVSRPD